ncbi:unnamed protein product [Symbiodinium sp. KB8]|nr:unnamed protein product [Symbiodinium sp. KB8]
MIGSFGGEDDAAKKKAAVVSIVAGFLYGVSWWVFIDAFALNSGDETTKRAVGYAWLPLVGTTIAFIM